MAIRKRAILVLGMHRSGTSACARIANLLGAGLPDDLLPPNEANEKGYWEPRAVVEFNDRLLARLDHGWDDPTPDSELEREIPAATLDQAASLIGEVYGKSKLIVVKDPRCTLIPKFWISALQQAGYEVAILYCTRPAADVAASLERRDGLAAPTAALLWAQYNINVVRLASAHNLVRIDYPDMRETWPQVFADLAARLEMEWPVSIAKSREKIEKFLDPARSASPALPEGEAAAIAATVEDWVQSLPALPAAKAIKTMEARIQSASALIVSSQQRYRRRIGQLHAELDTAWEEGRNAQSVIRSLEGDLETARHAQADADSRAQNAQTIIATLEGDLETARHAQADADSRAQNAQTIIATLEGERDEARQAFSAMQDEAQGIGVELAKMVEQHDALHLDFQELERSAIAYREHSERLEEELKAAQADYVLADVERLALRLDKSMLTARLAALENSSFWRMTGPLRRLLSKAPGITRGARSLGKFVLGVATLQFSFRRSDQAPLGEAPGPDDGSVAGLLPASEVDAPRDVLPPLKTLEPMLVQEFGPDAARRTVDIIRRYALPFQREGMPAVQRHVDSAKATSWARRSAKASPDTGVEPAVSIIIPVYNQIAFTLACIESVQRSSSHYPYEILVGDDLSTDGTEAAAQIAIPGVKWIRHTQNLGFVRNCNETARHARGRYVVFLNNDTIVLPGWLDELVGALEADDSVGLAGSKLIYPDGRLQEAGGIFWQDGSAWNFGRFDDPRRPEYCYAREVDYVSGASIAIPRPVWETLGGFDDDYAPAYAEDADLAFRLRASGYKTLYQPRSQLLHFEGVSSGTDTGAGIKAYQVINLERLQARWAETLASHRPNAVEPEFEKERKVVQRALFVDITTPEPQHDAGSLVAVECMRALKASGFKVTFVPQDNFLWTREYSVPLQRDGIEVIYHPYHSKFRPFIEQRGAEFDFVFLHRYQTAERTISDIRECAPGAKIALLNADLHYLREMREAELLGDAAKLAAAEQTRIRELAIMRIVDLVLTHSTVEQEILSKELGEEHVMLLPLVHDPEPSPLPFESRQGIGFLGGFGHPPNLDAVDWFLEAVWPLVRAQLPDASFVLAGSKMPARLINLDGKNGLRVLGFVETLGEYFDELRLNVVPLRFGAGAKGKVAASLACGVPTVSSEIGIEGMGLVSGRDVAVASSPDELAAEIVRMYRDEAAWNAMREAGLAYADTMISRTALRRRILEMSRRLGLLQA